MTSTFRRRHGLLALAGALALALPGLAGAQAGKEIRIAHVYSRTGPLEAYGKQTQTGLMMGFDYATGGTMTVAGKKIVVIEKDDQGKPDVGKSLLAAAYGDDKADIAVGPTSSGVALALLPVAEEYKKILLVEPAVADSITGDKWNKYIFRTGRNSSQDAISNAVALDKPGQVVATLAQDNAFGQPLESQLRSCLLASWMAEAAGLDEETRATVYWVALLRFIGCTGHAHEVSTLFGDEIAIRGQTLLHDSGNPAEVMRDIVAFATAGRDAEERDEIVRKIQETIREWAFLNFSSGCEVGDMLLERSRDPRARRRAAAAGPHARG